VKNIPGLLFIFILSTGDSIMRSFIFTVFFLPICSIAVGQASSKSQWYSETTSNGITIQNSFPRGGPYTGPTKKNFNYSHLVFFTRIVNETGAPIELLVNFSADSIPIPFSPDTFVKLFLPPDTMTMDKQSVFDYGVKALKSFDTPTRFQRTIKSGEDCLFNIVAIFYQTKPTAENRNRGGNRAELVLKGQKLFYNMPAQIEGLYCGEIIIKKE
jgi:hypothetical protein